MKSLRFAGKLGVVALASILMVGAQGLAFAHPGGGGGSHGGFHGGGASGPHGGGSGRPGHGGGGPVGPWRGPWRGYGGYGGYYGWGAGWWGLGLGVYLTTLPWYYSTFWWDGVPYYYVDSNYYLWDGDTGAYQQVQPPTEVTQQAVQPPQTHSELFAYPNRGQTPEQQVRDKSECSRWATGETGFNPLAPASEAAKSAAAPQGAATWAAKEQNYLRAEGTCLQARGYTVG
jgi:hypothetical protein